MFIALRYIVKSDYYSLGGTATERYAPEYVYTRAHAHIYRYREAALGEGITSQSNDVAKSPVRRLVT